MSDLRDKLAALGRRVAREPRPDPAGEGPAAGPAAAALGGSADPAGAAEVLGAAEQACPSGSVLVRTTRYACGAPWGDGALDRPELGRVLCGYVGGGLAAVRDPARTVFVDTETTGLTGGSGTYAFLVGIGRFHGDAFVLRQLFLRGPWEERALLEVASLLLEGAAAVVTYNGKSFDVPLLRSRLAYHRMPDPLRRTPHVDLLHLARRLWRERLPACALGDVERGALGMGRGADDVPGHLIPELYFAYLRRGDAAPLRRVMHHNALDVCTLAALLRRVDDLLEGRFDAARVPPEDLASLARTREALGDHDQALALFGAAAARLAEPGRGAAALACDVRLRAGRLAKRLGRHDEAAAWFRGAAREPGASGGPVEAAIELAKLAEHQDGALAEALAWVRAGLGALQGVGERAHRERLAADLTHRLARLERRLAAREPR